VNTLLDHRDEKTAKKKDSKIITMTKYRKSPSEMHGISEEDKEEEKKTSARD